MTLAVQRALALLKLFSISTPEIGLSQAARLSGESKATVFRLLTTLCESGLVEQTAGAKTYRLGPALLDLARVREATVPLLSVVQPVLDLLLEQTGETCHFSRFNGQDMAVVATAESRKANRVTMQGMEFLPICTSAAGQVFLAFSDAGTAAAILAKAGLNDADRLALEGKLKQVRDQGFAIIEMFEDEEIFGVAGPVLAGDQGVVGALAVAIPPHRMTADLLESTLKCIKEGTGSLAGRIGT